uniref:Probable serine/threonine-protein kinase DDB_G0282963 isoform X2 n=1 Tax=Dermatophagoides pteronyssinus TaxID=6956 RepID=A0A6P6YF86_DERPT|nr:probable serine/threonine-protein kinase DDB_G0282963 isoform X2 [Dermatophagoides pteronyssinus]
MVIMPHKLSSAKSTSCLLSSIDNGIHHVVSHQNKDHLINNNNNLNDDGDCALCCWSPIPRSSSSMMDICCNGDSATICNVNNHNNVSNPNICSSFNSTNTSGTLFIGKCRNVRLRRTDPNQSLGFSIRGGWEHGIGFYVSDVQPDSLAAKQGLCPGDQIFRINGFPLDRVIHDEVVALIRMSANDLTLRVRSVGVVPFKGRGPGDKLSWKRLCAQRSHHHHNNHANNHTRHHSHHPTRPRSASSLTTPASSTISSTSDDHLSSSDDQSDLLIHPQQLSSPSSHNHHHRQYSPPLPTSMPPKPQTLPSNSSSSSGSTSLSSKSRPIYCSNYNEQHLYIQCHQPGSSLGCSVVNGPTTCPGIFVQHVKEGKLAQKCGLEIGDQIVRVNNLDVSVIGFDGAISMLKSLTNISLLVRKGVARHIFECRDHYSTINTNVSTSIDGSSEQQATLNKCHYSSPTKRQQQHQYFTPTSCTSSITSKSSKSKSKSANVSRILTNNNKQHSSKSKVLYSVPLAIPVPPPVPPPPPTSSTLVSVKKGSKSPTKSSPSSTYQSPHHYKTLAAASTNSPTFESFQGIGNASPSSSSSNYCSAYSSVQISASTFNASTGSSSSLSSSPLNSCAKNRCCCERQRSKDKHHQQQHSICNRPSTFSLDGNSYAHPLPPSSSSSVVPVLPPAVPPVTLFTNVNHVDQVTNAVTNSIRILQEVREKEEKLVEASRKLNEEHEKLCREKEKLEIEKKELLLNKESIYHSHHHHHSSAHQIADGNHHLHHNNGSHHYHHPSQSSSSSSLLQQHHYSTIGSSTSSISSTSPNCPSSSASSSNVMIQQPPRPPSSPPMGTINSAINGQCMPQFSFLEEIKAMGENGRRRHLRPVNSIESNNNSSIIDDNHLNHNSSSTMSAVDKNKLLRRPPFGCAKDNNDSSNGVGCSGVGSKDASDNKKRQHELLMEEFRIAHQKMFGAQNRQRSNHNRLNDQQGDGHDDDGNDDDGQNAKDKNDHQKNVEDQRYRLSSINNNNNNNVEDHKSSLNLSNHHHTDDNMVQVESSSTPAITTLLNVFPRRNLSNQTTMSNQHGKQIPSSLSSSSSTLKPITSTSIDRPILSSFSKNTNTSIINNNNISKNRSVEMDHSISLSATKFVLKKSTSTFALSSSSPQSSQLSSFKTSTFNKTSKTIDDHHNNHRPLSTTTGSNLKSSSTAAASSSSTTANRITIKVLSPKITA